MIKIVSSTPSKDTLKTIYDTCNRLFQNENIFYSKVDVKKLKDDKNNIFIK